MARTAYLMDRLMARVGLSGKSFIPLLSSFACAVPGVMATRVIENERDRLTTILVAPLLTCSARLPIYALLIAAFIPEQSYLGGLLNLQGLTLAALYLLGIVAAVAVALLLKRTILRGRTPPFLMELPSYKWPSPRTVLFRMTERGWVFLRCAGHADLGRVDPGLGRPLLSARSGGHPPAATARQLLGPRRTGDRAGRQAAGLGLADRLRGAGVAAGPRDRRGHPRRDVPPRRRAGRPAAEPGSEQWSARLHSVTWDGTDRPVYNIPVALSIMVFFALCAECAATLAVIRRETNSWRWPAFTFAYMTALAYVAALATYQVGMWIGGVMTRDESDERLAKRGDRCHSSGGGGLCRVVCRALGPAERFARLPLLLEAVRPSDKRRLITLDKPPKASRVSEMLQVLLDRVFALRAPLRHRRGTGASRSPIPAGDRGSTCRPSTDRPRRGAFR